MNIFLSPVPAKPERVGIYLPSFLGIKSYISLAEDKLSLQATSRSNRRDRDDPQHSMKIDSRPFCRRNIIFGQTTIGDENDT